MALGPSQNPVCLQVPLRAPPAPQAQQGLPAEGHPGAHIPFAFGARIPFASFPAPALSQQSPCLNSSQITHVFLAGLNHRSDWHLLSSVSKSACPDILLIPLLSLAQDVGGGGQVPLQCGQDLPVRLRT